MLSYNDKLLLQSTKPCSLGVLETNSKQELYGPVKGEALGSTSLESRGVLKPKLDDPIRRWRKGFLKMQEGDYSGNMA